MNTKLHCFLQIMRCSASKIEYATFMRVLKNTNLRRSENPIKRIQDDKELLLKILYLGLYDGNCSHTLLKLDSQKLLYEI